jgi:hypothetical protein
MKAIMMYEAMFGNTEKIARAIAQVLERSAEVEVVEVTEPPSMPEVDVDLIVAGGPTHAFWDEPVRVTDWPCGLDDATSPSANGLRVTGMMSVLRELGSRVPLAACRALGVRQHRDRSVEEDGPAPVGRFGGASAGTCG